MLRLSTILQTFYIKPTERGILFYRHDFQCILTPGTYRYFGSHWNVEIFDVQASRLELDNLAFLLQEHTAAFAEHCEIVQTIKDEVALVETPFCWHTVGRDAISAFWRGWQRDQPIQVHRFNLAENFQIPSELVTRIQHLSGFTNLKFIYVPENQVGFLYRRSDFLRVLMPGNYGFWDLEQTLNVQFSPRLGGMLTVADAETLIEHHPDFVAEFCELVTLTATEVAIVRDRAKIIAIVPPVSCQLFWKGVAIEVIDTQAQPQLPMRLIKELVLGKALAQQLSAALLHTVEVPAQHVGLLNESGAATTTLEPGWHAWWTIGRSMKTQVLDLRLQVLEISGQEILSKDKVALRLNLTASYRITDPIQATTAIADLTGFLYKELQFALRGAVGTKTLDQLLDEKQIIDTEVLQVIQQKTANYGITIVSVGVKDIILPGEMKVILAQVVEAEKAAQANVIRRREETAATRSMLNTARVMENNPTALRLKELEVLERIAEKIDSIEVHNGFQGLLSELVSLRETN